MDKLTEVVDPDYLDATDYFTSEIDRLKNQATELEAKLKASNDEIERLNDQLENGIEYSEELNCYVVVWTKKQIEDARFTARQISEQLGIRGKDD